MNPHIPREEITWHPTINYDACLGDRVCVDFCANDVFAWDEEEKPPIVRTALNCVVGCGSCAQQCPLEAITFPDREELRAEMQEAHLAQSSRSERLQGGRG